MMNIQEVLKEMRWTANERDDYGLPWEASEVRDWADAIKEVMREKDAEIKRLARKVEYLSKNNCMGCIDAICDDCAGKKKEKG